VYSILLYTIHYSTAAGGMVALLCLLKAKNSRHSSNECDGYSTLRLSPVATQQGNSGYQELSLHLLPVRTLAAYKKVSQLQWLVDTAVVFYTLHRLVQYDDRRLFQPATITASPSFTLWECIFFQCLKTVALASIMEVMETQCITACSHMPINV